MGREVTESLLLMIQQRAIGDVGPYLSTLICSVVQHMLPPLVLRSMGLGKTKSNIVGL